MTTLTEGKHAGGFLTWEVLSDYTRETITIASGAGKLAPGTVLGQITASGKYAAHDPNATDGTETAVAVLWGKADASGGDATAVAVVRGPAIVNRHEISWPEGATEAQITTATTALAGLGIKRGVYVHINNSNPILCADTSERAAVEAAGWEVAADGMEFEV